MNLRPKGIYTSDFSPVELILMIKTLKALRNIEIPEEEIRCVFYDI